MKTNWTFALAAIALIAVPTSVEAKPRTYKPYQTTQEKPLPAWVRVMYPTTVIVVGKIEDHYIRKAENSNHRSQNRRK